MAQASRTRTKTRALAFEPVGLEGQAAYLERLALSPQTASDYSFINIWAWAEEYGLQWAFDESHVWLRQTRPETALWAPVGPWDHVDWTACLCVAGPGAFIRVPESLALTWRAALGDRVELEEAREHWDYIYARNDLVALAGNRFHKKKNLLNQFVRNYDPVYHPMTINCVEAALDMQGQWMGWRDAEGNDVLAAENRAIQRVLTNWDRLSGVFGGVVEVKARQVAYTVAEKLTPETLVIHFEKGHTQYKGVYQAINQMFLAGQARGFERVNREQDLGDEGLRKAKLSYNPVDFVKKFKVRLR